MVIITGDLHGDFDRLNQICEHYNTNRHDVIVLLGDVGINYFLNEKDTRIKKLLAELPVTLFCIQGNHEKPAKNIPTYKTTFFRGAGALYEEEYPNIIFPIDGNIYCLNGYQCLVIGGAYSVDKWWRLARAGVRDKFDKDYLNSKKTGWFPDEQLTEEEMNMITNNIKGRTIDFVFTHTCPETWEPRELFLRSVDQSTVDKTMEQWLDEIKDIFDWRIWCCGHYHGDMVLAPYVEMFYTDFVEINDLVKTWEEYRETRELPGWCMTSQYFKENS